MTSKYKKLLLIILLSFSVVFIFAFTYIRFCLYNYKNIGIKSDDIITSTSNYLVIGSSNNTLKFYDRNLKLINKKEVKDIKQLVGNENLLLILKKDGTVWEYDVSNNDTPIRITNIKNADAISFGGFYLIYKDKDNTYLMQIRRHTHPDYLNCNLTLNKPYKINNINNMEIVCNSYALALIDNNCKLYITDKAKIISENGELNYKEYLKKEHIEYCSLANNFSFIVEKNGIYYNTPYSDMSEKQDRTKVGKVKQFAFCQNRYILNSKGKLFEWGIQKSVISNKDNLSCTPERVCRFETYEAIYPTKDCLFAKKQTKIYALKS